MASFAICDAPIMYFVNLFTIALIRPTRPIVYSTRVHARIPNGHPRDDPRAEVGEDVRVGVCVRVGPMEFQLNRTRSRVDPNSVWQAS